MKRFLIAALLLFGCSDSSGASLEEVPDGWPVPLGEAETKMAFHHGDAVILVA